MDKMKTLFSTGEAGGVPGVTIREKQKYDAYATQMMEKGEQPPPIEEWRKSHRAERGERVASKIPIKRAG